MLYYKIAGGVFIQDTTKFTYDIPSDLAQSGSVLSSWEPSPSVSLYRDLHLSGKWGRYLNVYICTV